MTGPQTPEFPASGRPWFEDGPEVDRYLDGELDTATRAARDADLEADTAVAARLDGRRAYLAALGAAGRAHRDALAESVPQGLALRVRAGLAEDSLESDRRPTRRSSRWLVAAAALALVGLGTALWSRPAGDAVAMPPEILKAAEAARMTVTEPGPCADTGETSPVHFPPVKDGSLRIMRCVQEAGGTVARLYRPEDLPSVGYVAVAAAGAREGPTIGMTDVGDYVVYDLAYGRKQHYLAVSKRFLAQERARNPGRESCRACHNRSREGEPNPHNIVARSWHAGG